MSSNLLVFLFINSEGEGLGRLIVVFLKVIGATEISSPVNALTLSKDTVSYLSYTYNDVTVRANTSSSLTDTR
jgi:hypothetical protein